MHFNHLKFMRKIQQNNQNQGEQMSSPDQSQNLALHPRHVSESINNLIEERDLARSQVLYQKQLINELEQQIETFKDQCLQSQKELARLSNIEEQLISQRDAFEDSITKGQQLISHCRQDPKEKPTVLTGNQAQVENTVTRPTAIKRRRRMAESEHEEEGSEPVVQQPITSLINKQNDNSSIGSLNADKTISSLLESITLQVQQLERSDLYKLLDISVCKKENATLHYRLESRESMVNAIMITSLKEITGYEGRKQLNLIHKHIQNIFNARGFTYNFERGGSRMITAAKDQDFKGFVRKLLKVRMQ